MEERKEMSTQVKVMILLIVIMTIGIALRWNYVKHETGTMLNKMFPAQKEVSR